MIRIYLEKDNVKLTLRDDLLLNAEFSSGKILTGLSPRRLFPVSKKYNYITLLDENEQEVAIVRDVKILSPENRNILIRALDEYYLIPKIMEIKHIEEKNGRIHITAVTDHGECCFDITDRSQNIKLDPDGRVILRDTNHNRYEIPDIKRLDRKSLAVFLL